MPDLIPTISLLLAWLMTSHALTRRLHHTCPQCGERLVQGIETPSLFCVRCRRWQR